MGIPSPGIFWWLDMKSWGILFSTKPLCAVAFFLKLMQFSLHDPTTQLRRSQRPFPSQDYLGVVCHRKISPQCQERFASISGGNVQCCAEKRCPGCRAKLPMASKASGETGEIWVQKRAPPNVNLNGENMVKYDVIWCSKLQPKHFKARFRRACTRSRI